MLSRPQKYACMQFVGNAVAFLAVFRSYVLSATTAFALVTPLSTWIASVFTL